MFAAVSLVTRVGGSDALGSVGLGQDTGCIGGRFLHDSGDLRDMLKLFLGAKKTAFLGLKSRDGLISRIARLFGVSAIITCVARSGYELRVHQNRRPVVRQNI